MKGFIAGLLTGLIAWIGFQIWKRKQHKDDPDLIEMYKQENFNLEKKIKKMEKEIAKGSERINTLHEKLKTVDNATDISDADIDKSFK